MGILDLTADLFLHPLVRPDPPALRRGDLVDLAAELATMGLRTDLGVALSLMSGIRETSAAMRTLHLDPVALGRFEGTGTVAEHLMTCATAYRSGCQKPIPMIGQPALTEFAFLLGRADREIFEVAMSLMVGLPQPSTVLRLLRPTTEELEQLRFHGGSAATLAGFAIWRRVNRTLLDSRPGKRARDRTVRVPMA